MQAKKANMLSLMNLSQQLSPELFDQLTRQVSTTARKFQFESLTIFRWRPVTSFPAVSRGTARIGPLALLVSSTILVTR
jgi:hypothetical protein